MSKIEFIGKDCNVQAMLALIADLKPKKIICHVEHEDGTDEVYSAGGTDAKNYTWAALRLNQIAMSNNEPLL